MKWFRNECKRRREALCLLASGALPESEVSGLEAHLSDCAACRKYFTEVKEVAAPLASWERGFASVEPDHAVKERWFQAIAAAAPLSAATVSKPGKPALTPALSPRRGRNTSSVGTGSPAAVPSQRGEHAFPLPGERVRVRADESSDSILSAGHSLPAKFLLTAWFELIWPARRIWAGLAAVWVTLAIFNFTQGGGREVMVATATVPAAEVRLAFQEQQRLLAEILGPPLAAAVAEPPRRGPQPRSDRRAGFLMA
jgi:hypothetical protein